MRCKWFRYSLRSLFAVTTLWAVLFGVAAWDLQNYRERARAERDDRDRIQQLQGSCTTSPCGPKWLSFIPDSIRPSAPHFVTSVSLPLESTDPGYSDEVLELLGEFKYVKRLTIEGGVMKLVDRRFRPGLYVVDKDEMQRRFPHIFYDDFRL